ncbi:probable leucine-rich repeat receptor-like protein kinase At5g63930 [Cryptomeria japonica]|uniref:probable leucine-rich repeat receptor-like protein kinase At5g63930 n=1 Tax=Cryptomeria japonica TaxID=3369 RepID=UPI0027D9FDA9|nr:probable leucine-rich repeat receptor-like protein kinase At5g63930 [Cryptomeria japonica]
MIPASLGQIEPLEQLDLSQNSLSGKLPVELSNLSKLSYWDVSFNHLCGPIPGGTQLMTFDERSYQGNPPCLCGYPFERCKQNKSPIVLSPSERVGKSVWSKVNEHVSVIGLGLGFEIGLGGTISLLVWWDRLVCYVRSPRIRDNFLSGRIPATLTNCTALKRLKLSNNFFNGDLEIQYSSSIEVISSHSNNFSGTLPASFANCTRLKLLDFSKNRLAGELSSHPLANCLQLRVLILSSNELKGDIALWIRNLTRLQMLDLSKNKFGGRIPSALEGLEGFKNHTALQLGGNTLYEDIPAISIKGTYLRLEYVLAANTILDLSHNNLRGEIPSNIGNLSHLRLLNLCGNQLEGKIPASLGQIEPLEQLDLSKNSLTGEIPWELTRLSKLSYWNVSFNRLCGPIPQGKQLMTFDERSYQGNSACLCGFPLQSCKQNKSSRVPSPPEMVGKSVWSKVNEHVSVIAVGLGFGVALGGTISVIVKMGSLASREHWLATMILYRELGHDELEVLATLGLHYMGKWPRIRVHTMMMTTLVERWDNRYNTLHHPTGEATVALLDVWRILKIPIRGVIPEYQLDVADFYLQEVCEYETPPMLDRSRMHLGRVMGIQWISRLVLVICGFLSGRIIPDLGGHGFPVGWSRGLYFMIHDGVQYAWGAAMLAQLYHDMHLVVYREYASLSAGVTLLHI